MTNHIHITLTESRPGRRFVVGGDARKLDGFFGWANYAAEVHDHFPPDSGDDYGSVIATAGRERDVLRKIHEFGVEDWSPEESAGTPASLEEGTGRTPGPLKLHGRWEDDTGRVISRGRVAVPAGAAYTVHRGHVVFDLSVGVLDAELSDNPGLLQALGESITEATTVKALAAKAYAAQKKQKKLKTSTIWLEPGKLSVTDANGTPYAEAKGTFTKEDAAELRKALLDLGVAKVKGKARR